MTKHAGVQKLLAALLAVYTALGMGRVAATLAEEGQQVGALAEACQDADAEISALRNSLEELNSPEEVRRQAWKQLGMVSPDDVVFFDGG